MRKLIVIAMVLGLFSIASAETWNGGVGNWNVATNWNTPQQVPTTGSTVNIGVNGSVVNVTDTQLAWRVLVGNGAAAGDTATLNISGSLDVWEYLRPGTTASRTGILNVDGNVVAGRLQLAWGGTGYFTMNGGTVELGGYGRTLTPTFFASNGGNSVSYTYLNGGVLDLSRLYINPGSGDAWALDSDFRMAMGNNSTATLDISGGAIILPGNVTNLKNVIAINTSGTGTVILTGYGVPNNFAYSYDAVSNKTTVTAIPEPATVALLGLGALVLTRRKRS